QIGCRVGRRGRVGRHLLDDHRVVELLIGDLAIAGRQSSTRRYGDDAKINVSHGLPPGGHRLPRYMSGLERFYVGDWRRLDAARYSHRPTRASTHITP